MSATLLVSPAAAPFPWAAAAIATCTGKADLAFDPSTSGVLLELSGSKITSEDEIVLAIAKLAGLADDSSKVQF
jgi:glutamyl-tRNA synthetase